MVKLIDSCTQRASFRLFFNTSALYLSKIKTKKDPINKTTLQDIKICLTNINNPNVLILVMLGSWNSGPQHFMVWLEHVNELGDIFRVLWKRGRRSGTLLPNLKSKLSMKVLSFWVVSNKSTDHNNYHLLLKRIDNFSENLAFDLSLFPMALQGWPWNPWILFKTNLYYLSLCTAGYTKLFERGKYVWDSEKIVPMK